MALVGEIAAHFEGQANACDRLGSPFTARLCRLLVGIVDGTTRTGRRIRDWPGNPRADALALRLCGGLHRLVIENADADLVTAYPPYDCDDAMLGSAIAGALERHDDALFTALESPPQTNEIARSAMLLPGFLTIARASGHPLALVEIGSSAGLNLLFDRFFYRYGEAVWGDPGSPVRLEPEVRGSVPLLDDGIAVVSREGCDIAPVDVARPEGRQRLRSYVWPDQSARLERLDGAIALAARTPFSLQRADAAAFVRKKLSVRPPGAAFVLFHSIMQQYLPQKTWNEICAALEEAGRSASADAPIAHLRMEPIDTADAFATLSVTQWPGGETRHLARCDYHGRWIEWLA